MTDNLKNVFLISEGSSGEKKKLKTLFTVDVVNE